MEVVLRGDEADGVHTKFTVFMNGIDCGQLTMTEEEAVFFHEVVIRTKYLTSHDKVMSKGIWMKEEWL
jgi:hypothetical protein